MGTNMPNNEVGKKLLTPGRLLLAVVLVIVVWNVTGLF